MKVTEATDGNKIVLYYEIRNDAGMSIGSAFANNEPFEGCEPVTLEEAKKNAHLWAAAPDLLEALEAAKTTLKAFLPDAFATIALIDNAIKKAREL